MDRNTTHDSPNNAVRQAAVKYRTLAEVLHNDSTVHRCIEASMSEEEVIIQLVNEKELLLHRIMELESLCPKKIVADGKTYRWDCPTELLP